MCLDKESHITMYADEVHPHRTHQYTNLTMDVGAEELQGPVHHGDWMQFTNPNSGQPHWCHPDGRSFCSSLEKDDEHPAAIGPAYVLYVGTFPETVLMPTATVISSLEPTWRNFSFLDSVDEKNLVVNAAGFDAIQAHASAPEH